MGGVDHLGAGNPRKQVFRAPGEAGHLVGKGRSQNENMVVIQNFSVDIDGHIAAQRGVPDIPGDFLDVVFRERSDLG